jgi:multidrug efflux pump subunit AcrA (membrane-fusion protein)
MERNELEMNADAIRNDLISAATNRLERIGALLALAEEERQILISGRHVELTVNLERQDALLIELSQLDKREEALAMQLKAVEQDAPKSRAFDQAHASIAGKAAEIAIRLKSTVETNRELLSNALQFISFSVGILTKLVTDQPGSSSKMSIMLDLKV